MYKLFQIGFCTVLWVQVQDWWSKAWGWWCGFPSSHKPSQVQVFWSLKDEKRADTGKRSYSRCVFLSCISFIVYYMIFFCIQTPSASFATTVRRLKPSIVPAQYIARNVWRGCVDINAHAWYAASGSLTLRTLVKKISLPRSSSWALQLVSHHPYRLRIVS